MRTDGTSGRIVIQAGSEIPFVQKALDSHANKFVANTADHAAVNDVKKALDVAYSLFGNVDSLHLTLSEDDTRVVVAALAVSGYVEADLDAQGLLVDLERNGTIEIVH